MTRWSNLDAHLFHLTIHCFYSCAKIAELLLASPNFVISCSKTSPLLNLIPPAIAIVACCGFLLESTLMDDARSSVVDLPSNY